MALILISLLAAGILRKCFPILRTLLIPTSVLAGGILVAVAVVYKLCSGGRSLYDEAFFGYAGSDYLELLTYHCLALGFIASAFKPSKGKLSKARTTEIFNTGVTTVATYLLQGVVGMAITIVAAYFFIDDFFPGAGILLPFGYGQGTGQALNYGGIYEEVGFVGGKSFGLTIAALGFLSACFGGVIHLNILKKRGLISVATEQTAFRENAEAEQSRPMKESIDKLTVQIALIFLAYFLAYLLMYGLGTLLPSMRSVIYGFNFLLGVLTVLLIKAVMNWMRKKDFLKKEYTDAFLMTRAGNLFFDVMVVAGIAAINFEALTQYWGVIAILGVVGLIITYIYNYFVAKRLFPAYTQEQFLVMYGMLTGTASTGIILLREIDGNFKTPAADNLVYQNVPAIVFGFPIMLLAALVPEYPVQIMIILAVFFCVMNLILFRSSVFRRKKRP